MIPPQLLKKFPDNGTLAPDAADLLDTGEGDGPDDELNVDNWDFC